MVIVAHATYLFPSLPCPVHRLAVMGWIGVQLFFLASAVSRRFFRLAPAY
jgi:hypothetical protein